VDLADSIAYDAHDVDDALQMGLLSMDEISELAIVRRSLEQIREKSGSLPTNQFRQVLVHALIDLQVGDLLQVAVEQLRGFEGQNTEDVSDAGLRLDHSESLGRERTELESFLFDTVYRHPRLMPVRDAAAGRLKSMFEVLVADPKRLPMRFRQRAERHCLEKVVGEYLAGMTDDFCDNQHRYAIEPDSGPLADW
jgi:dGTPase